MGTAPPDTAFDPTTGIALPPRDPLLASAGLDLEALAAHWARQAELRPMTAEEMRGADARAQRLGLSGDELMEAAGAAVAAAASALLLGSGRLGRSAGGSAAGEPREPGEPSEPGEPAGGRSSAGGRSPAAPVLVLCGPGNNGGDGLVAARYLARAGLSSVVALVSGRHRPETADAARNWDRLDGSMPVARIHAANQRDVSLLLNGIERAALVIDALLGSGVSGLLREPIRTAVDVALRGHREGVPVLAVDTPTALDMTSGQPSDPVVRADVTVTFHRPKHGLLAGMARPLVGRLLVAPIGIPLLADRP